MDVGCLFISREYKFNKMNMLSAFPIPRASSGRVKAQQMQPRLCLCGPSQRGLEGVVGCGRRRGDGWCLSGRVCVARGVLVTAAVVTCRRHASVVTVSITP